MLGISGENKTFEDEKIGKIIIEDVAVHTCIVDNQQKKGTDIGPLIYCHPII
jgi:hypothetical protein